MKRGILREYKDIKKAIAANTANVEVYYKLASACYDEEMTNDAINMYKKVIETEPNHVEARYDLALVYLEEGLCEDGITDVRPLWASKTEAIWPKGPPCAGD